MHLECLQQHLHGISTLPPPILVPEVCVLVGFVFWLFILAEIRTEVSEGRVLILFVFVLSGVCLWISSHTCTRQFEGWSCMINCRITQDNYFNSSQVSRSSFSVIVFQLQILCWHKQLKAKIKFHMRVFAWVPSSRCSFFFFTLNSNLYHLFILGVF